MATLALTIGASLIPGGKVVSALTMALAGGIGNFVDQNFLFADMNGEEPNPGIGSFQANLADEGSVINYAIGEKVRLPANIVWAGPVSDPDTTGGGQGKRAEPVQTTYWRDVAYGLCWNNINAIRQIDMNGRAVQREAGTFLPGFQFEIGNAYGEVSYGTVGQGFSIESVQTWEDSYSANWRTGGVGSQRIRNGWRLLDWEMIAEFNVGSISPQRLENFVAGEECTLRWYLDGVQVFPPFWEQVMGTGTEIKVDIREAEYLSNPNPGDPQARLRLDLAKYFIPFRHPNPQTYGAGAGFETEDPRWWAGPRNIYLIGFGQPGPGTAPVVLDANFPGPRDPVAPTTLQSGYQFEYEESGEFSERTWRPGAKDPEFWDGTDGQDQTSPIMEEREASGNVPGNQSRAMYIFQDFNISKYGGALPNAVFHCDARRKNADQSIRDTSIGEAIYWLMGDLGGVPKGSIDTGWDPDLETSTHLTGICDGYSLQSLSEMSKHIAKFLTGYDLFMAEHSGKIIVREHGQRDRVDVLWGDLGARTGDSNIREPIELEDQKEIDTPARQNVKFADTNKDLQKGTQHSSFDGTLRDDGVARTNSQIDLGALAIDSTVARNVAERIKRRSARRGRQSTIQVPLRYMHIVPGDVLPIAVPVESQSEFAGQVLFFMVDSKRIETTLLIRLEGTVEDVPPDGWSYLP